ncbi:transposase (plasmid) [Pandoraea faecigallinarum]|uniref:Transposase n=2 Tax=Pandoraea TaxID=93217 RepID=A0A0H3X320_9BURK|nr:transposase [Pandoraea faecigallinarum]AKM33171.1 transposase [Pandoraea faecigallinarum]AKM33250.1 transposase [Pandoraea faecigallinarum]
MADKDSELRVVRQSRDGRRRYDEKSKQALIEAALRPGVSVARLAQEHGVNANLLRKWITKYLMAREQGILPRKRAGDDDGLLSSEIESVTIDLPDSRSLAPATAASPAFVPVVSTPAASAPVPAPSAVSMQLELHVRLANGVELEMGRAIASIEELTTLVQILGRMPCSGSTKA